MTTEYDPNAWLNQFNPSLKSKLAHIFLRIIREGETEIEVILDAAFTACCERSYTEPEEFLLVLPQFATDIESIATYVRHQVWREGLSSAEKAALKTKQAEAYRLAAMRTVPPTGKQLEYLRSLGYTGPLPEDRATASTLIDEHLASGQGR